MKSYLRRSFGAGRCCQTLTEGSLWLEYSPSNAGKMSLSGSLFRSAEQATTIRVPGVLPRAPPLPKPPLLRWVGTLKGLDGSAKALRFGDQRRPSVLWKSQAYKI